MSSHILLLPDAPVDALEHWMGAERRLCAVSHSSPGLETRGSWWPYIDIAESFAESIAPVCTSVTLFCGEPWMGAGMARGAGG